ISNHLFRLALYATAHCQISASGLSLGVACRNAAALRVRFAGGRVCFGHGAGNFSKVFRFVQKFGFRFVAHRHVPVYRHHSLGQAADGVEDTREFFEK
ncbi:MAG TPA: hypothetical protein VGM92_12725, partial [Candidatus Kapabacteria bacterium]